MRVDHGDAAKRPLHFVENRTLEQMGGFFFDVVEQEDHIMEMRVPPWPQHAGETGISNAREHYLSQGTVPEPDLRAE